MSDDAAALLGMLVFGVVLLLVALFATQCL